MNDFALCIFVIDQDRENKYSDARNDGKTNEEVLSLARDDAEEMCLATMFIAQADKQRFGKLQEELANDFTKGNDNYLKNLVEESCCRLHVVKRVQELATSSSCARNSECCICQ